ncbi:MAG: DUF167 domain-containing protein [Chloroflexi bacterium]|nr:DUF167 domain-containing protein [Chloroflexota bacterium]
MPTLIQIRVQPRAKANSIDGYRDGLLRLRVTAAPEKGAANAAVIELLAEALDVPKSRLRIAKGESARAKLIAIEGLTLEDVRARLGIS